LFVDVENICVVSGESYFSIQASSSHYQALLNDLEAAVWISSFTVWTIGDRALFRTWSGTSVRLSQMRQFLERYEVVPQSLVTTTEAVLMHFQCRSFGRQKHLEIKDIDLLISRAEVSVNNLDSPSTQVNNEKSTSVVCKTAAEYDPVRSFFRSYYF
jgi:hypothetical protein